MKRIIVVVLAVILGFNFAHAEIKKKPTKTVCFKSNMDCTDCENKLNEYLKFEKGVKNLKVDHISNTIMVEYTDGKNSEESLAKAVQKKGYDAEKITEDQYKQIVKDALIKGHDHSQEGHVKH